jgi:hypothetical protein
MDILSADIQLVRLRHVLVKDALGKFDKVRVSNPSAVMTGLNFPEFIGADLRC